jgi:hypothetical protein
MVMALGCVGTGWLDDLGVRLAVGFLATAAPWETGPSFGFSIDGACAAGKPGMGSADVVLMSPVYALYYAGSSTAHCEHMHSKCTIRGFHA